MLKLLGMERNLSFFIFKVTLIYSFWIKKTKREIMFLDFDEPHVDLWKLGQIFMES